MDTKNTVATNLKETDKAGGTDVKTIDMSGTNMAGATNTKTLDERTSDIRVIDGTTKDSSIPAHQINVHVDNDTTQTSKTTKLPTVKVRLLGDHTYEGISYESGDIVDVDEQSANYITEISKSGVRV
ncbi:hypothetical protein BH09PAT1_BH09PAT1_8840 [soil metagenome]